MKTKSRLSPPNGIAFNIPIVEVNSLTSSLQLKEKLYSMKLQNLIMLLRKKIKN